MFFLSTWSKNLAILEVSTSCWEGGELGKVESSELERWESSELGRWERCVSGVRWQRGKGGRIVRCHGRRGGSVMRWQFGKGGRVVSREGGMKFKDKTVFYCSREAKCKQGFPAGI